MASRFGLVTGGRLSNIREERQILLGGVTHAVLNSQFLGCPCVGSENEYGEHRQHVYCRLPIRAPRMQRSTTTCRGGAAGPIRIADIPLSVAQVRILSHNVRLAGKPGQYPDGARPPAASPAWCPGAPACPFRQRPAQ